MLRSEGGGGIIQGELPIDISAVRCPEVAIRSIRKWVRPRCAVGPHLPDEGPSLTIGRGPDIYTDLSGEQEVFSSIILANGRIMDGGIQVSSYRIGAWDGMAQRSEQEESQGRNPAHVSIVLSSHRTQRSL